VALDLGHEGERHGPWWHRVERSVLQIARLRDRINQQPNMRAFNPGQRLSHYTKWKKSARRVQADLFVSIHVDARFNKTARRQCFALSEASSSRPLIKQDKENSADGIGGLKSSYQGLEPKAPGITTPTAQKSGQPEATMVGEIA
jgi:N-acetylmuramoyl-L-alanine amidase